MEWNAPTLSDGAYHLKGSWTLEHQDRIKHWLAYYQRVFIYRDEADEDAYGPGLNCFRNGNGAEFSPTVHAVSHGKLDLQIIPFGQTFEALNLPNVLTDGA